MFVDSDSKTEIATKSTQVRENLVLPAKRMSRFVASRIGLSDDLPVFVDAGSAALTSTKSAQIGYRRRALRPGNRPYFVENRRCVKQCGCGGEGKAVQRMKAQAVAAAYWTKLDT